MPRDFRRKNKAIANDQPPVRRYVTSAPLCKVVPRNLIAVVVNGDPDLLVHLRIAAILLQVTMTWVYARVAAFLFTELNCPNVKDLLNDPKRIIPVSGMPVCQRI